ncbi:MAG: hypothetical protein IT368_02595 [Candidatus Hydrogenedentes bacterium]|nr:hypothetical protein [Candidatus Hydrogenedentota bacterium]
MQVLGTDTAFINSTAAFAAESGKSRYQAAVRADHMPAAPAVSLCQPVLALRRHRLGVHRDPAVYRSEPEDLTMAESHTLDHSPRLKQSRLWFGFAAPAVAWAIQESVSFFITWQACQDGDGDWGFLSVFEVRAMLVSISIVLLAIAMAAGGMSYLSWRRLSADRKLIHAEAAGREEFMGFGGIFICAIFAFGIILGGLGPLLVGVCETAK